MLFLKISFMTLVFAFHVNLWGHLTVVGFRDTLKNSDQLRLDKFIEAHQLAGHNKCYYDQTKYTVVCVGPRQMRYYFK